MTGALRGRSLWLAGSLIIVLAVAVPVAAWRSYWDSTPYDYSLSLRSRVLSPRVLGSLPSAVTTMTLPVTIDNCPDGSDVVCNRTLALIGPRGLSAVELRDQVVAALVRNGWTRGTDHLFRGQVTARRQGVAFAGVATADDETRWDEAQGGIGGPLPAIVSRAQRDGRGVVVVELEDCRSPC